MAKWPFIVIFFPHRTISHHFTSCNYFRNRSLIPVYTRLVCQIDLDITASNFFVVSRSKWEICLRWRLNHARLIFPPSRVILPGSSFKRNISEVSLKRELRILQCNFRISSCLCNSTEFRRNFLYIIIRASSVVICRWFIFIVLLPQFFSLGVIYSAFPTFEIIIYKFMYKQCWNVFLSILGKNKDYTRLYIDCEIVPLKGDCHWTWRKRYKFKEKKET